MPRARARTVDEPKRRREVTPTCAAARVSSWPRRWTASLAALLALALVGGAPALALADTLAVIDLQGAVMQTEDGIRAQATLKKLFDRRQQDIDGKQTELAKMKDDIERQARILSREALSRRMEAWQREMLTLQSTFVDADKELQKKQSEMTAPIIQRMVAIVARLAKQNSYDVVIDKRAAPYSRSDLDLTERVIQLYNSGDTGAP